MDMDFVKTIVTERLVEGVALLAGAVTAVLGLWAYVSPGSFADFADFPAHTHFVHDLAAFQLGIGATLLLAVIWSDTLSTVLAGFLLANTAHVANHVADLDHGGRVWQLWALAVLSVLVGAALAVRLRALDYVVGPVGAATDPALLPYIRRRTALVTSPGSDDEPDRVPVTIAVDGDHAYASCFETSVRAQWFGADVRVQVAPVRRGESTADPMSARIRRLEGPDARDAVRSLRRKYPLLHGILLPLAPRFGPSKEDECVYLVLTPDDAP